MAGDPYFDNVSLLLHMDGSNGSTSFTDSSSLAHGITVVNGPVISTTRKKYGSSSCLFSGAGRLEASGSAFTMGTGDFTLEAWVYQEVTGNYEPIITLSNPGAGANTLYMNQRKALFWAGGAIGQATIQAALSTWHHIAVTYSGGYVQVFVNGVPTTSPVAKSINITSSIALIGGTGYASEFFDGYIDEVRITKGVARYTGTFSVPTEPFYDGSSLLRPSGVLRPSYSAVSAINNTRIHYQGL